MKAVADCVSCQEVEGRNGQPPLTSYDASYSVRPFSSRIALEAKEMQAVADRVSCQRVEGETASHH